MTTGYLVKQGLIVSDGLDRRYQVVLYHMMGIPGPTTAGTLPFWTPANTEQTVFVDPVPAKGSASLDLGLAGAICVKRELVSGPWWQADGTGEAIVSVTYDSDRRWGSAFRDSWSISPSDENLTLPCWTKGEQLTSETSASANTYAWRASFFPMVRAGIIRSIPVDATGITENQKALIYSKVGQLYKLFGVPYILRTPLSRHLRTNQVIVQYQFFTKCPVQAIDAGVIPGVDTAMPGLGFLDEYVRNEGVNPPSIGVRKFTTYGAANDPTELPFWGAQL